MLYEKGVGFGFKLNFVLIFQKLEFVPCLELKVIKKKTDAMI